MWSLSIELVYYNGGSACSFGQLLSLTSPLEMSISTPKEASELKEQNYVRTLTGKLGCSE